MSKLALGTGVFVVVAAGGALYLQHQSNADLRQEIALLRQELRAAPAPSHAASSPGPVATTTSAEAPLAKGSELAQLRSDIASLKKSAEDISAFTKMAQAAAAAKSLQSADSVPVNLTPANALKNAGKNSPEASTETVLWAAVAGEVDTLADTLVFTPSARGKADAWFASLSESTRQQYGTPEKVMALMIARDAAALTGMQVIGQKEITANDVGVRVRFGAAEGRTKEDTLVMHRASDGWRMLLSDQVVEKFARQLGGKK